MRVLSICSTLKFILLCVAVCTYVSERERYRERKRKRKIWIDREMEG